MTPDPQPQRLKDGSEYADAMTALSQERLSDRRLQRSKSLLRERIADSSITTAGVWGRWLIALPVPAIILTLFAGTAVAFGVGYLVHKTVTHRVNAPRPDASGLQPRREPTVEPEQPESASEPRVSPTAAPPRNRIETNQENQPPPVATDAPESASAASIHLAEQLRAFRQAESFGGSGKFEEALSSLDRLEQAFPETPLKTEIALKRLEFLFRSGQYEGAVSAATSLVDQTKDPRQMIALYLVLGDSWLALDNCREASRAYQMALDQGLSGQRSRVARIDIEQCEKSTAP